MIHGGVDCSGNPFMTIVRIFSTMVFLETSDPSSSLSMFFWQERCLVLFKHR